MAAKRRKVRTGYPLWILFLVLGAGCLFIAIFFGFKKEGFHEDEYYTYYSSNRTAGLFTPDREWVDTNTIEDEFLVLPGERFTYLTISEVQSWDVHPPLYYHIFHTVAGFMPGGFSKWPGLITNYIAMLICFALLNRLMKYLEAPVWLRLLVLALWGLHPITVSMEMFIRMYMWLTVWILAATLTHVRFMVDISEGRLLRMNLSRIFTKYFLPMLIVTFLGFLTHYYYLVFHFFIGVAFITLLIFGGHDFGLTKVTSVSLYAGFHLLAYAAAFAVYPAAAAQLFTGYRGEGARTAFLNIANTGERFGFFFSLLNDDLFLGAGIVIAVMLVFCFVAVYFFRRQQARHQEMSLVSARGRSPVTDAMIMMVSGTAGYFFIVAKTALVLGATSNRYVYPVYPLMIMIVVYALYASSRMLREMGDDGDSFRGTVIRFRIWVGVRAGVSAIMVIMLIAAYIKGGRVLFLYEGDRALKEYAAAEAANPAVILYNGDTPYNIWRLTNTLIEYPYVFLASESNTYPFEDVRLLEADTITVYAADGDNRDALLELLASREITREMRATNTALKDVESGGPMYYSAIAQREMWTVYRFEKAANETP